MKFKSEPKNDLEKYIHDAVEAYLSKRHGEFWMDYAEEVGCSLMEATGDELYESEVDYLYLTHIATPFGDDEYLSVFVVCSFEDDSIDIEFSFYAKDQISKQGLAEVLDAYKQQAEGK